MQSATDLASLLDEGGIREPVPGATSSASERAVSSRREEVKRRKAAKGQGHTSAAATNMAFTTAEPSLVPPVPAPLASLNPPSLPDESMNYAENSDRFDGVEFDDYVLQQYLLTSLEEEDEAANRGKKRNKGKKTAQLTTASEADETEVGGEMLFTHHDKGPLALPGHEGRVHRVADTYMESPPAEDGEVVKGMGIIASKGAQGRGKGGKLLETKGKKEKERESKRKHSDGVGAPSVAAPRPDTFDLDPHAKPSFDPALAAITFKIDSHMKSIVDAIEHHDTIVVMAPTGTGKSTRIPEEMVYYLRNNGNDKLVLCTVPTRKASEELWKFQCKRTKLKVGFASNSVIKYNKRTDDIAYTTTGHLVKSFLGSIQANKVPSHCGVLMVDEAHDGKVDTFLLLSLVRYLRRTKGMKLKLIISSATIAKSTFEKTFPSAAIIDIEERHLPVACLYHTRDYVMPLDIKVLIKDMITVLVKRHGKDNVGTKIVFLPGEFEIQSFIEQAEKIDGLKNCRFFPAYSSLLDEEIEAIFQDIPPEFTCKVVVATDIFEHSLTLPGVTFIIDSGLVKVMKISSDLIETLALDFVSQSSANQRKGRTGRTCEGTCYRMYTEGKFNSFPGLCGQEIDNIPLHRPIIDLLGASLSPFDIMDDIPDVRVYQDLKFLSDTDLVRNIVAPPPPSLLLPRTASEGGVAYEVTEMGQFVQQLPVGIKAGIFLFHACDYHRHRGPTDVNNIFAALIMASIFEIQNAPFYLPARGKEQTDKEYTEMCNSIREKHFNRFLGESDFSTYLKLFCCMMEESKELSKGHFEWSDVNHMNNKVLKEWRVNFSRILRTMKDQDIDYVEEYTMDYEKVCLSLEPVFEKSFPKYIFMLNPKAGSGGKAHQYISLADDKKHLVGRTFNTTIGTGVKQKPPMFVMALSIRRTVNLGTELLFLQQIFTLKERNRQFDLEVAEARNLTKRLSNLELREDEDYFRKQHHHEKESQGKKQAQGNASSSTNKADGHSKKGERASQGPGKAGGSSKKKGRDDPPPAGECGFPERKGNTESKENIKGGSGSAGKKPKVIPLKTKLEGEALRVFTTRVTAINAANKSEDKKKYPTREAAMKAKIDAAKAKREAKGKEPLNPPRK